MAAKVSSSEVIAAKNDRACSLLPYTSKHAWCHSKGSALHKNFGLSYCKATHYLLIYQGVVLEGGSVRLKNLLRIHGHFVFLQRTNKRVSALGKEKILCLFYGTLV